MARSVLSNAQDFKFKDIELNGSTEGWEDDLPIRLAPYEFVKVDGAEQEPMGTGAKAFSFRCCFMGPDCGSRYRNLAVSVQKDPRGPLVHPRLGTLDVACRSIRGRENPGTAIDVIEFTIDFIENQLGQAAQLESQPSASQRASQVDDALAKMTEATSLVTQNRIANTIYAACVAAAADLNNKAAKFRELALTVAQTGGDTSDLTGLLALGKVLAIVGDKRDAALLALTATLSKTLEPDVTLTDARTAIYIAYAACVQLNNVVIAQFPPIVDFTVPTPMPLTTVLVRIYGPDARSRRAQLYQLNRIPTPYWIPAGTVLRVLAPPGA